ncbi:MAG: DUF885 domain-containing protein [Alphaproteobacteria bacterium]|nr:DUF885 domain-containing protein [Alphaproteobacteria bacterium]
MFTLASDLVDRIVQTAPGTASLYGVGGTLAGWDDLTPEGTATLGSLWRDTLRELDAAPVGDRWDALAADVLRDACELELGRLESGDHLFDLNILASGLQIPGLVVESSAPRDGGEVDALVARLHGLEGYLAGYRERLSEGLATGRVVARRQVLEGVEQARQHGSHGSAFAVAADLGTTVAPERSEDLARGVARAHRAFGELADWLSSTYLPQAPERDAVGAERYAREAARHLGMVVDPLETSAWGWEEVRAIEGRMRALVAELGHDTVSGAVEGLRADPTWCAPTPDAFLERMRALQSDAVARLHGEHFDVPGPLRSIDVLLAPPGGPLGAYYRTPSEDGTRPGAVCYRLEGDRDIPWFHEVSTAYHEGFPGHHLQLGTGILLADRLSRHHRLFAHNTGHAEGWALYAERLMLELGFLDHPALELGYRINELARAYRVVVDIGLHLELDIPEDAPFRPGERWTFDLAVEAMRDRAMLAPRTAHDNVVRYLGWPGQAIAYKVGERVIREARDVWMARPGATLRDFHSTLLEQGSMGLGRLRARMVTPG